MPSLFVYDREEYSSSNLVSYLDGVSFKPYCGSLGNMALLDLDVKEAR